MNNLVMRFPNGLKKCLTLSFDDGVEQDMQLGELMKKYGIAGTFNISTGNYAPEGKVYEQGRIHRPMTLKQCLALYKDEPLFEVATHGLTHPFLTEIPAPLATYEIYKCRADIEEQYGTICRGHAYPYGAYNDTVIDMLRNCGIVYARTTHVTRSFGIPQNWLILDPTCHYGDARLPELTEKFIQPNTERRPWLFYVYGHSYELERDNNWNVIEEFFEKTANRDDVWYATNIEVCDYANAFDSLITSADGKTVYNPTDKDVWICTNAQHSVGHTYKVPAGETVTL